MSEKDESVKKGLMDVVMWIINLGANTVIGVPEGKGGGCIFVIGDSKKVMAESRLTRPPDPITFLPPEARNVFTEEFVRWFYSNIDTLDGAIIIDEEGNVLGTSRYLPIELDGSDTGVGARHLAANTITRRTSAISVVVSAERAIRIYYGGYLVNCLLPFVGLIPDKRTSHTASALPKDPVIKMIRSRLGRNRVEMGNRMLSMIRGSMETHPQSQIQDGAEEKNEGFLDIYR